MARQPKITKAKAEVPRFQLGNIGYSGLNVVSGQIQEELKRELTFPTSVITYKQMAYDGVVAAAYRYADQTISSHIQN